MPGHHLRLSHLGIHQLQLQSRRGRERREGEVEHKQCKDVCCAANLINQFQINYHKFVTNMQRHESAAATTPYPPPPLPPLLLCNSVQSAAKIRLWSRRRINKSWLSKVLKAIVLISTRRRREPSQEERGLRLVEWAGSSNGIQ